MYSNLKSESGDEPFILGYPIFRLEHKPAINGLESHAQLQMLLVMAHSSIHVEDERHGSTSCGKGWKRSVQIAL